MKKRLSALLLAAVLSVSAIAGAAVVPQQADTAVAAEKKVKEYGKPWIDSNVAGMVTKSTKHNLKDDYSVGVNFKKHLKTKLRPGYTSEGTFTDSSDIVEKRMQGILTDTSFTEDYAALVREYYQMFLDWGSRNAAAREHFDSHLEPIQNINDLDSLTAYLESEESKYYGVSLFGYGTAMDFKEPSRYNVSIYSTDLSLGDSDEYENETPYGQRMKKYVSDTATYVLKYAGYSDPEIAEIISDSFAFEKELSGSIFSTEESRTNDFYSKIYNPCTADELAAQSGTFPLKGVIDAAGYGSSYLYSITEPAWLARINELYNADHVRQMKNYLLFHYAIGSIDMLDEAAYRESQRLDNELDGTDENREDEYYAYSDTKSTLWSFVDRMYVSRYCSKKMKNDARKLMQSAITEYKKMLKNETWLSSKTRQRAINKLNHITLCPAYPDKWEDWSSVTFKTRAEGGSYQSANEEINRALLDMDMAKINQTVDKQLWGTSCTSVNASYWHSYNRILVYAGILTGDFYNEKMSEEEMMGGIGAVIGHEISHAFDTSGSQFDEEGRFANWWTKADRKEFDKRASKLIKYYDSIKPFKNGQNYSGTIVQTEATADMGGLKVMLLSASRQKNFDYDKFFRAYANVWFDEMPEEALENTYMQNEHPIPYLRTNVTLAQFDEFQKTYDIKPGDGMYIAPKDRITIW